MIVKYKFNPRLLSILQLDKTVKYSIDNIYTHIRHMCIGANKNIIPMNLAYILFPNDNNFKDTKKLLSKDLLIPYIKNHIIRQSCSAVDNLLVLNIREDNIPVINNITIYL